MALGSKFDRHLQNEATSVFSEHADRQICVPHPIYRLREQELNRRDSGSGRTHGPKSAGVKFLPLGVNRYTPGSHDPRNDTRPRLMSSVQVMMERLSAYAQCSCSFSNGKALLLDRLTEVLPEAFRFLLCKNFPNRHMV